MMPMTDLAGCDAIRAWLSQRCGIHYPPHKSEVLRQRLARVQRAFTLGDLAEMARHLIDGNDRDLQLAVMHAASTNHTYFFREPEVLDVFRSAILPLIAQREQIRIWSAACSTGDEVFTLAILIAESCGLPALKRTLLLGTDLSAPVIATAESGLFTAQRLDRLPNEIRQRYFLPEGSDQFRIRPELREACTFRRMNLKMRPYPFRKTFQAVFCRNLLYYFEKADQTATLRALHDVTEPGGWLVTSVTENLRDLGTAWQPFSNGIYRRAAT